MSRELRVGLVTALAAIAATGVALWSSSPQRPAVPDTIELRVANTPTARAAGSSQAPRSAQPRGDAETRDDDRPPGRPGAGYRTPPRWRPQCDHPPRVV